MNAIEKCIESIKAELKEFPDLMIGATCFADLHDTCDANTLGNSEQLFESFDNPQAACDALNAVQNAIDAWIKDGAP